MLTDVQGSLYVQGSHLEGLGGPNVLDLKLDQFNIRQVPIIYNISQVLNYTVQAQF